MSQLRQSYEDNICLITDIKVKRVYKIWIVCRNVQGRLFTLHIFI